MSPLVPSDVALRDGGTVHVRPVRAADTAALVALYRGLSQRSRYFRFFSLGVNLDAAAERFATAADERGLVAETGAGELVAHADYVPDGHGAAEVAFAVADAWQGHGIATILLLQLAEAAAAEGIASFLAVVLPENRRMLETFRWSGFHPTVHATPDGLDVEFPTRLGADGRALAETRLRRAAVAGVAHVLNPASIVVVGASRRPGSVGFALLEHLSTFTGPVHLVGRHRDFLRSVADVPGTPELGILAVPAALVPDAARACAARGVRALIVLSAGFAETGPAGAARQDELLRICRGGGMRLLGPNCLGAVNTDPVVALDATFAGPPAPPGSIAFASQSGAFGIAVARLATSRGAGLSAFVSLGNKADLSGNDMLQAWEADDRANVIALYLESFGNPRRFGEIARRVTRTKPVVVLKAGRTEAGQRATRSHTGALLAAADTDVDALFAHAGVIRVDTVGELLDVAALLARQPLPRGPRVAIVTNAGGPGILGADACAAHGLEVRQLSPDTQQALAAAVPAAASVANPVDLVATATPAELEAAIEILAADPDVDAVIAAHIPLGDDPAPAADVLLTARADKPILGVLLGAELPGAPLFAGVEEAAVALSRAVRYAAYRDAPADDPPTLSGADPYRAAAVVSVALASGGGWLDADAAQVLLSAYGIPVAPARGVRSPRAAREAARAFGGPVAVKAIAPGLVHKTDAGGVALNCRPAAAERAARAMRDRIPGLRGFLVQPMAGPGTELLVGVSADARFGPLVAAGAGGTRAELDADIAVRLAPLGPRAAATMLRSLRCYRLLTGFRDAPAADLRAVEDLLVRAGALAAALPAVAELDLNPVLAGPEGVTVLDWRVRVAAPPTPRPFGALD